MGGSSDSARKRAAAVVRYALVSSVVAPWLTGCGGQDGSSGLQAWLRVDGATFVEGPPPPVGTGPRAQSLDLVVNSVAPGQRGKHASGALSAGAEACILHLDGDRGHWRFRADPPDVQSPDSPTFMRTFDLSPSVPLGERALLVYGADAAENVGEPAKSVLRIERAVPVAPLTVTLRWDRDADLDLHLQLPSGEWVYPANKSSASSDGAAPDGGAAQVRLDLDSNANCVIDGIRSETAFATEAPSPGRYTVHVDAYSLCGETAVRYSVEVWAGTTPIANAEGVALPFDTRGTHGAGAGVKVVAFDVP